MRESIEQNESLSESDLEELAEENGVSVDEFRKMIDDTVSVTQALLDKIDGVKIDAAQRVTITVERSEGETDELEVYFPAERPSGKWFSNLLNRGRRYTPITCTVTDGQPTYKQHGTPPDAELRNGRLFRFACYKYTLGTRWLMAHSSSYGMVPAFSACSEAVGSSPKTVATSPTRTSGMSVTSSMHMSMQMRPT